MLHPLSNSNSLLGLYMLLLSGLKSAELVVLVSACEASRTDVSVFCDLFLLGPDTIISA